MGSAGFGWTAAQSWDRTEDGFAVVLRVLAVCAVFIISLFVLCSWLHANSCFPWMNIRSGAGPACGMA